MMTTNREEGRYTGGVETDTGRRFRILRTDGRWKAGEIGTELENDWPDGPYQVKLALGAEYLKPGPNSPPFLTTEGWYDRIFYFRLDEVEEVRGE